MWLWLQGWGGSAPGGASGASPDRSRTNSAQQWYLGRPFGKAKWKSPTLFHPGARANHPPDAGTLDWMSMIRKLQAGRRQTRRTGKDLAVHSYWVLSQPAPPKATGPPAFPHLLVHVGTRISTGEDGAYLSAGPRGAWHNRSSASPTGNYRCTRCGSRGDVTPGPQAGRGPHTRAVTCGDQLTLAVQSAPCFLSVML